MDRQEAGLDIDRWPSKDPPFKEEVTSLFIREVCPVTEPPPPYWRTLVEGHDLCLYTVKDPKTGGKFYALCEPTTEDRREWFALTEDMGWLNHDLAYSITSEVAHHERK